MLSVIIPTYNRAQYLSVALKSLTAQTLGRDQFEVIVVCDGGTDNTKKIIESYYDKLDLKYIDEGHGGVSHARNLGIKNAKGEVLVFFDDDAVAKDDWLERTLEIMQSEDVVIGRGKPLSDNIWKYFAPHYDRGNKKLEISTIWECNMAIKKSVFDSMGLFNEEIGWGHEGNEFASRLLGKYKIEYYPEMVILHDYSTGYRNYFKKQFIFGQKLIYLKKQDIKSLGYLISNYDKIKKLGGVGDGGQNEALNQAPVLTRLWVKIVAKLGSWVHFLGSIKGYFKYR